MKQFRLFEGQISDDLDECANKLIDMANELGEDVFLMWNGEAIRVNAKSTVESVLKDVYNKYYETGIVASYKKGKLINVDTISQNIAKMLQKLMVSVD